MNFLVTVFMFLFLGIAALLHHTGYKKGAVPAIILGAIFVIWDIVLLSTKKFKWRYREVLELSAKPVKAVTNGFTSRPLPIGKIEYNKWEIKAFANFLLRNLIAIPRDEEKRIVLVVTWKMKYLFKSDYGDRTWVAFNNNGEVSVSISKQDYYNYQAEFSFDELCTNLGELFVEFFNHFREGQADSIIEKLNGVRESPFI